MQIKERGKEAGSMIRAKEGGKWEENGDERKQVGGEGKGKRMV